MGLTAPGPQPGSATEEQARTEGAPRAHENAKRGNSRLPATGSNGHGYKENGINSPPPHFNGKEEALGSNPREGLEFEASEIGSTTLIAQSSVASLDSAVTPAP
jgi:hypothetical protein